MGINLGGMGSGLPPNIVDQLMDVERIPLKTIQGHKAKEENRLKLVTELETKLNAITGSIGGLASTKGFTDMKLNSGDANVVQGTVDPANAQSGSWNIEVEDLAQKAAAITNGFPDKDKSQVGVGYFRFSTQDGDKEIYINGSNNTLQGVANAINSSGQGVKASILNDRSNPDAPYKLMVSGDSVGGDHQIQYPTLYFLDGDQDLYFDEKREAKNGKIKVDGFEFEIGENKVSDVIPGVTLELKQANPGRTVNLSVKEDKEVVTGKVKTFVDAVNGVFSFVQAQNTLSKTTDTSQTLGGDSLLRSVESRMRALVQNPQFGVKSEINRLNQLGIVFNRSGVLEYDEKRFNETLARNPADVQRFLAGDGFSVGFIPSLKREVGTMLDMAFGPVAMRKRGLQEKIGQMDKQIEDKERQLTKKEEMLRNKFAKLDETMSRLRGQGAAVGALGGGGAGGGQMQG
jgi:flagellar hook-associated protein 2